MRKKLKEKISEALSSVLPITVIVLLLSFTLAPMPIGTLLLFLLGAAMLIVGMGFFSLGADMAMMPIGEQMGRKLGGRWKLIAVAVICFLIGAMVTIAEPDLQVLARQVPAVPDAVIILAVAAGVGVFLVVSMLRTRFNLPLGPTLIALYTGVFLLSIFVPNAFLAVAFDSGGVTTGPITVPFLMALGTGMASIKGRDEDNFGMVALCSVGPILAVMLLGLCYQSTEVSYTPFAIPSVFDSQDVGAQFLQGLPDYMKEVALGLLPIILFFAVFQLASIRLKRRAVIKIIVGIGYTYVGLVLFLTGANIGFMPAGYYLGTTLAALPQYWMLVPIGMVVGYFIVAAEPAVHVLNRQVEDVTSGAIPQKAIGLALSIGVAVSIGLAMLRVCLGIPIYYLLVPGYAVALLLTRCVPRIFTAIAFDSGGVASGPMTATFLLPLTMGACEALGRDILTDAFGVVAMVAMTPLITIQLLGLIYQRKIRRTRDVTQAEEREIEFVDEIIDYNEEVEL
ncbi:DUF1538 domain-containing protein [Flavonifractor sp. DFI.6.63]|uniref:DUF1538 domain-containing protein n=1 Tax=Lawsonibacter hominis TaxID=2763053 RepID=A0A8J6M558_9FIRM|nr:MULTISPECIES: DUF1538 domain-containing protein [Oscillospiraceae]MBC5733412.1 DUF1538 domain-containing protein [Lawsonibacter hominis]MCI6399423.1 DUF1538 domain-containing protein [Lawsonibacter sp.]MCQ5029063.1 DUF1538 domain-containing protein [Flavonifractor sp. DFI.6.63]MDY2978192.1 DUF1538 domain-containing protein [Oscillospiraceae bacterium]